MATGARGYGTKHRKERERWIPLVESGQATCWRCGIWIAPSGEPCPRCGRASCGWDLGHDDYDRTITHGPEHSCENRRAGARRGGRTKARNAAIRVWSREWLRIPEDDDRI